jgi:hypothetical protein
MEGTLMTTLKKLHLRAKAIGCAIGRAPGTGLHSRDRYEICFPNGKTYDGCFSYLLGTTVSSLAKEIAFFETVHAREEWDEEGTLERSLGWDDEGEGK